MIMEKTKITMNNDFVISRRTMYANYVAAFIAFMALLVTGMQYKLQYEADKDQKKQAVINIQSSLLGNGEVSSSFFYMNHYAHNKSAGNLKDFDYKTGALYSYFWVAGSCIYSGQCDPDLAKITFCSDYVRYRELLKNAVGLSEAQERFSLSQFSFLNQCL